MSCRVVHTAPDGTVKEYQARSATYNVKNGFSYIGEDRKPHKIESGNVKVYHDDGTLGQDHDL